MADKKKKTITTKKKRTVSKLLRKQKTVRKTSKIAKTAVSLSEQGQAKCPKCCAKRLYSPFNKFFVNKPTTKLKKSKMAQASPNGLTSKELSYLKATCQRKKARYTSLRVLAEKAKADRKIFTINGSGNGCDTVRQQLKLRGWVEKIPPCKMNLKKIRQSSPTNDEVLKRQLERLVLSGMVSTADPNFIWNAQEKDFGQSYNGSIKNYLSMCYMWTSKQGLCQILNNGSWYCIEDVAEVNHPRTYLSDNVEDLNDLMHDFKLTACTSLLKWIISMSKNKQPIHTEDGKISSNVVVFALSRCKEYLLKKQNKDIDRSIPSADTSQWNTFLKRYYEVIEKKAMFKPENPDQLYLYVKCAKLFLKEMIKYRPQISCEGSQNIWILKPAHCARGHGIRMSSKLGVITNLISNTSSKFVIQKYIEVPLLIHNTKFDIRQYYLVTSTQPLIIWMYKECYLKFSSQNYSLKNYHESIHLTNNAIQKKYTNSKDKHEALPASNMWDLMQFRDYLESIDKGDLWESLIFPGMRKSILGVMLNCQNNLLPCKNRFQLYGCDFILDKTLKPWLIEINANPDLNNTTNVTAKICPELLSDLIKVVIDHRANPRAPTGKFINIYKMPQSIMQRHTVTHELFITGRALPLNYFYRGDEQNIDPVLNEIILKKRDIKDLMKKLSTISSFSSENSIISSSGSSKAYGKAIDDNCTDSDIELNLSANVITGVLNNIIDNIDDSAANKLLSDFQKIPKSTWTTHKCVAT